MRLFRLAALAAICVSVCAAPVGTSISDTIYDPYGVGWSGTIYVDCPSATDAAGNTIVAAKKTVTVAAGVFTAFTIDPGDAGEPVGRTCTARFVPSAASASSRKEPWTETWYVPTSVAAVAIKDIRTSVPSSGTALYGYAQIKNLVLGDVLYGASTTLAARLPGNTAATQKFLRQTGTGAVSAAPSWGALEAGDIPSLSATYQAVSGKNVAGGYVGLDGSGNAAIGTTVHSPATAEPACDATKRGYIVRVEGGAGVADTNETLLKDTADAYAWLEAATTAATGPNYIATESGANNAIVGSLTGVPLAAGLTVTVKLAHTLQAGANTFDYNGGGAVAIKSGRNVANDIGTAYAATGVITLMYDGTQWVDCSQ